MSYFQDPEEWDRQQKAARKEAKAEMADYESQSRRCAWCGSTTGHFYNNPDNNGMDTWQCGGCGAPNAVQVKQ